MKIKINIQVYLDAAELVASAKPRNHEAACRAIVKAKFGKEWSSFEWDSCRERQLFGYLFAPSANPYVCPPYWFGKGSLEENQNERILALLFMHQIAKDNS